MSCHNGCLPCRIKHPSCHKPGPLAMTTPEVASSCAVSGRIFQPGNELGTLQAPRKDAGSVVGNLAVTLTRIWQARLVMNRHPIVRSLLLVSFILSAAATAQNESEPSPSDTPTPNPSP